MSGTAPTTTAVHELWRVEYQQKAYVDQTGKPQSGYVVYEQVLAHETGRFDQFEEYARKTYENVGIVAVDEQGREFRGTANLVDYCGGRGWRATAEPVPGTVIKGRWIAAPRSVAGYCYSDGTAPVRSLHDEGLGA